jgi:hypothetical protein
MPFDRLYSIGRKIGDGGFGSVFSGNKLSYIRVLVKFFQNDSYSILYYFLKNRFSRLKFWRQLKFSLI